ncbi:Anti-sigma-K factor rskA [Planctomycetes bacterium MalM25]|nr:Anti-sigma-K factor rskA [Planctomycetes bacterium MalM25]
MNATPPNGMSPSDADRLDDLLADRALFGLDAAETAELDRLLTTTGEDDRYDLAAATAAVALAEEEPLPAPLRERVLEAAAANDLRPTRFEPSKRSDWSTLTVLALAAALLAALYLGQPASAPSLVAQRASLIESVEDLVRVDWGPQTDASLEEGLEGESAYGDVVWSDTTQTGYMRFRGLKANDPQVEQYQLWVFDAERDDKHPVDGGVFDIPAGADEAIVAIDAKLPVSKAVLFAITVERPGGVVVSDRSRLPLLAKR